MSEKILVTEIRRRHGLTQSKMAQILDITPEYLSMIETGRKPLSKKLEKKVLALSDRETGPPYAAAASPAMAVAESAHSYAERIAELEARVAEIERAVIRLSNHVEKR